MLSKKDWQDIDKEFESYHSFCRQKQTDKDDCRAEIDRLEKEVERWKDIAEATESLKQQYATMHDTTWNDAIEAAVSAVISLNHGRKLVRSKESVAVRAAAAIRALKRSQA